MVGTTPQASGTTANNFTNPVTYTVTAADASTKAYLVTVTVAPDTTAPDTQIDTHPAALPTSASAAFAFSSADGTATFECSLDATLASYAWAIDTAAPTVTSIARALPSPALPPAWTSL